MLFGKSNRNFLNSLTVFASVVIVAAGLSSCGVGLKQSDAMVQAYRVAAAKKIMQANPSLVYTGEVPESLASIPVIKITVNADGSIRSLDVMRQPKFYPETVELAKSAIRRAAPFAPAGSFLQPWAFSEVFLFNDDLKFQLHSLQP